MIIIKTSNGDVLVNDQQMKMVEHDHANHVVRVFDANGTKGLRKQHPYTTIERVEGVFYTNEAQPTEWKDEGSLVKKMQDIIDKQKNDIELLTNMIGHLQNDLRHHSGNIIQVINYRKEGEMSDEIASRIRDDAEAMKKSGNMKVWELRAPYEKKNPDSKSAEIALIAELNEKLESSLANIWQLKSKLKEADRIKEAYIQGSERLYKRNLWQRIVNERVILPNE